jgi:drug/metabolite transporter (DMT)-like permease
MGIGEIAGLSAAMLWAFSSLLYAETKLTAWGMNFSKIAIAVVILFVQIVMLAVWNETAVLTATRADWKWLGLSGLIGLTIGDTFYFRSLQILGARRCLIVTTTAPVFAALLGWLWLGEVLIWLSVVGIAMTLAGIMWVILDGDGKNEEPGYYPGSQRVGIAYGVASSLCQAVGLATSKVGMETIGPLEGTFIRMFLGGLFALCVVAGKRQLTATISQVARAEVLRKFLPAVVCGTWLGVWFSQIAAKETEVGIAQTLLATCPLFAIPMVRMKYGTKITPAAVVGSIVAVVGICLIVLPDRTDPSKQEDAQPAASHVRWEVPPAKRTAQHKSAGQGAADGLQPGGFPQL